MLPAFIVEEAVRYADGSSPALDISGAQGSTLLLTLGINRIIEQESLDLAIHGSKDGQEWDAKPLAVFPQKFYCGTYAIVADLTDSPDVHYLRAQWRMSRWGRGEPKPMFSFYLFVEKTAVPVIAGAATS